MKFNFLNFEEKDYNVILILGIIFSFITFIVLIFVFKWNQPLSMDDNHVVNHELLGTYGDFFGGVIGTLFAILAALLMFSTLKSQRELTEKTNSLQADIARAATQSQENLAKLQAEEAKLQRFNSLFFELLSLFRSQRTELNDSISEDGKSKVNFFDLKMHELHQRYIPSSSYGKSINKATGDYLEFYLKNASYLAPIFRSLYRLIDMIDNEDIDGDEKRKYVKIIRAQLGEGELFFLRYNAMTEYGEKFTNYITKYNLLKHMPSMSLMEFKAYRRVMDRTKENTSLGMNIFIQNLRKVIYDITVNRSDYEDLRNIKIHSHSKYEIYVDMSNPACTVMKIIDHVKTQNKSPIFKAFTQFSNNELIGFMKYILKDIYEGSNFKTFNIRENCTLKYNNKVLPDKVNDIITYEASVTIQSQSGSPVSLRMSHPDWDIASEVI
ncbi:MAG: hypothetical protein HDS64_03960 [Bacteroidales bacterium]|nr:hypothetical protein [Bacteroidales bacterium]